MGRREIRARSLVAQVRATVVSAQAAALRRRARADDDARGQWVPKLTDVSVSFHGTTRERRGELFITPGRPRLAWLTPWRVRRFEIRCDTGEGRVPRLHIDGLAVDIPGTFPDP